MRHIEKGGAVCLELQDWINKSLGRTPVRVFIIDEDGTETLSQDWYQYYVGYDMRGLAEALFPWANAGIDEDFYDTHYELGQEVVDLGGVDAAEDAGYVYSTDESPIYPYAEIAGEIELYRLKLELNELGRAFLVVSDYMARGE